MTWKHTEWQKVFVLYFTGYIARGKMWSIILANLDPNEIVPCNSWG